MAFTCVSPLLFLIPIIIFIVLLPFGMMFPIKEKLLGLLELISKM